jgi:hypothetical protein
VECAVRVIACKFITTAFRAFQLGILPTGVVTVGDVKSAYVTPAFAAILAAPLALFRRLLTGKG